MTLHKRLTALILCAATLMLCGCVNGNVDQTTNDTQETIDPTAPLSNGNSLKLLAITSSFGLNTTQLLYDVAKAEGYEDVTIGRLYGSGCTLKTHAENAKANTYYYQYTKNNSGYWDTKESVSMLQGLQDEDWDIIFVQQSAAKAGILVSYSDYVDQLMKYVQENKTNPNARFVWNMTWAYQGDSEQTVFTGTFNSDQMYMYNSIVDVVNKVIVPRTDFDAIIPTGTAIQNARTSYFGDKLTKDTYHLNSLGRVIAAYTLYATLTGKVLTEVNLTEVTKAMTPDTQILILSDSDKQVIMEAVNAAIANPFQVTQSIYTQAQ